MVLWFKRVDVFWGKGDRSVCVHVCLVVLYLRAGGNGLSVIGVNSEAVVAAGVGVVTRSEH